MKQNLWRQLAAFSVLTITITAFIYYFSTHPGTREQLSNTSPGLLILLLALYLLGIGALAMVTLTTVRLYKVRLKSSESLLLTAYSSVINFFGPLQSGPAFRAIYLKKKHGLSLKNYTVATLIYYFLYGSFSLLLLLSGLLKWWLVILAAALILTAIYIKRVPRISSRLNDIDMRGWYLLALATFLQVAIVTFIYFAELHSLSPGIDFSQAVIYSGAANLSLFVSLTPGAIGFRESFLLFSQNLHHIDTNVIVAANIIDRAVYIVLLLLLGLFIFATHTHKHLNVKS